MALFSLWFSVRTPVSMDSGCRRRPYTDKERAADRRLANLHKPHIPPISASECGNPHNFLKGSSVCVNCLAPNQARRSE